MALNWLTAFKVIPWTQVVQNAPTVLRGAKKLWGMVGTNAAQPPAVEPSRLEHEVADVKHEVAKAAEVITSLAEQNGRLVEAVEILRVRTRVLTVAIVALSVGVIALAASRLIG